MQVCSRWVQDKLIITTKLQLTITFSFLITMFLPAAPKAEITEREIRPLRDRRIRRQRIFEKGEISVEFDINSLLDGDHIDDSTRKNLMDALGGFYFLSGGTKDPKMDLLLRAMQKEEFEEGYLLINEVLKTTSCVRYFFLL